MIVVTKDYMYFTIRNIQKIALKNPGLDVSSKVCIPLSRPSGQHLSKKDECYQFKNLPVHKL